VTDYEIFGPYLIALMMSLSALCVFIWAVLAGAFHGADEVALGFYRAEVENGGIKERPGE
jgi:hypothetical protein